MSALLFMPWFQIDQAVKLTEFRLFPFNLNGTNDPEVTGSYKDIVNVLSNYKSRSQKSVTTATIMGLTGKQLTDELSGPDLQHFFVYSEIIAFSGLSKRRFFSHSSYSNTEVFRLVGQPFKNSTDTPAISSRRRDGGSLAGFAQGIFQEICPFHVSPISRGQLDVPLIEAMIKAYNSGNTSWAHVYDAIIAFNGSNTDSPTVKNSIEVVLTLGAFERGLGLRGGREDELAVEFVKVLSEISLATGMKEKKNLKPAVQKFQNVREAWIRDFFRVRNDLAHGKSQAAYPSSWSTSEHMVLAAYIFPLLIKAILAQAGFYQLTDDDEADIFTFDYLLNLNGLFRLLDPEDPNSHPWNTGVHDSRWDWNTEKAVRAASKQ